VGWPDLIRKDPDLPPRAKAAKKRKDRPREETGPASVRHERYEHDHGDERDDCLHLAFSQFATL